MECVQSISKLREELQRLSGRIGFVPTMGYLHAGHMSLVERAKAECDYVVLSVFVNPLQFGENEDLDRYPRDVERDLQMARDASVDFFFHPTVQEMYPTASLTQVRVKELTNKLCGASRPGFFEGVVTVVSKLFNIVQPDRAYFGLKDAQQVAVIEQMVQDLNFPVEIVPCPIVREEDGLAMSSRNVYLSTEERKQALLLNQSLSEVKVGIQQGKFTNSSQVKEYLVERLNSQPNMKVDYAEVVSYPGIESVDDFRHYLYNHSHTNPHSNPNSRILVALAVWVGNTRLIDNVIVTTSGDAMNKMRVIN